MSLAIQVAATPFVTENTFTIVFSSQGLVLLMSLWPPNISTTILPLCSIAREAPNSNSDSIALVNTSPIFANAGSQ